MAPLFSSRVGVFATGGGEYCRASWPLGVLTLYQEQVVLKSLVKTYRLPLADIDRIQPRFLSFRIHHRVSDVPEFVTVWGFHALRRLKSAVRHHNLGLKIDTLG